MSLTDHVSLTISQDTVGIARAGFGVPMIASANATFPERIRFYNTLADVDDDFAAGTPEYLAASAMFSQSPRPSRIAIGRCALKPTLRYQINVADILDSTAYKINVSGPGITATEVSITSDASATNDEIISALVTALNAVVGNNYLAAIVAGASDTDHLTVTADAVGNWFSLEVVDATQLTSKMTHADPGIATDLAAIQLESDEWYCLHTLYNSEAYVLAAAAWIETQKKIYVFDVPENSALVEATGFGDTLDEVFDDGYTRTMGGYHPEPAAMFSAAWMGRVLPIDPGGVTWKFKTLAGVSPVELTGANKTKLRDRNANSYERIAGRSITWEGTSASGEFLDVKRDLDWLEDDMLKSVFGALTGQNKIPYTDAGVGIVENEVKGSLRRAVRKGVLAADPAPVVTVPLVADVSTADKALRVLPDVLFSGTLAGAIHKVTISGVVSA